MGRLHQAKRGIGDNFPYLLRVPIFGKCQKNLGTRSEKSWYQYIFFSKRGLDSSMPLAQRSHAGVT